MPKSGGAAVPFLGGGDGSPSKTMSPGQGLPLYQVASWPIKPFGHNRHGRKLGAVLLLGELDTAPFGELGPRVIQCGLGRGLPPY